MDLWSDPVWPLSCVRDRLQSLGVDWMWKVLFSELLLESRNAGILALFAEGSVAVSKIYVAVIEVFSLMYWQNLSLLSLESYSIAVLGGDDWDKSQTMFGNYTEIQNCSRNSQYIIKCTLRIYFSSFSMLFWEWF